MDQRTETHSKASEGFVHQGARLPEIDWLRVLAVFLVFLVHSAQIFSPIEDWHVNSPESSRLLGQFTIFLGPWIMPLFMLLAGASAWFARRGRSDVQYLKVRVLRLLVPLVAGSLLVVPPQIYYRRLYRGELDGSFLAFYPRFFHGFFPDGNLSWGHLWFIAYLFVYTLVGLVVFWALDRDGGRRFLEAAVRWISRPGGILLPGLIIALFQVVLRVPFTQTTGALVGDWATHGWLFPAFLFGYVFMADGRLMMAVDRQWKGVLSLALALSVGLAVWAWPGEVYQRFPGEVSWWHAGFWTGFSLCSWGWLVVFLGAARIHLIQEGPVLRWAVPLVYPFYIFHQTVIVVVGFYLVGVPLGVYSRFLLITLVSLAGTLLALEAVRRVPLVRNLFGLQPRLRKMRI
jgi:glucans biosynthesis protein C